MNRFALCALLALSGSAFAADIRTPNGKRVLFVDDDGSIRPEPGGKRLLFIDGNTLRPEPGGKTLLVLDGDDVRPAAGGIRPDPGHPARTASRWSSADPGPLPGSGPSPIYLWKTRP